MGRRLLIALAAASVLGGCGCTIDSRPSGEVGMHCDKAHDSVNSKGDVSFVCDEFVPDPPKASR